MYLDKSLLFAEDLAVTVTADATNVINLGAIRDVGKSTDLWLAIIVKEAFTAAGAATLTIGLTSDDNAALSSDTALLMEQTEAIGKATLVLGYTRYIKLQPAAYEQYLGLVFTVATGPMTAGKITAFITDKPQDWKAYADPL